MNMNTYIKIIIGFIVSSFIDLDNMSSTYNVLIDLQRTFLSDGQCFDESDTTGLYNFFLGLVNYLKFRRNIFWVLRTVALYVMLLYMEIQKTIFLQGSWIHKNMNSTYLKIWVSRVVVRDGNGHRPQRVCHYQTQTRTKFKLPNPPATRSGF